MNFNVLYFEWFNVFLIVVQLKYASNSNGFKSNSFVTIIGSHLKGVNLR